MAFDSHANLATSNVRTAPSPASSGTSLTITAGTGVLFPAVPFNATVWQNGQAPTTSNAEIVRVTNIATDTLTIVRAQEGTSARTIHVGDQIAATITAKTLTDVETAIPTSTAALPDSSNKRYVTDAELAVLAVTSGTNTGDQTSVSGNAGTATKLATARNIDGQAFDGSANITVIAPGTNAAAGKTTPVDADQLPLVDSAASNVLKKLTWANVKATLKTYFDTLYPSGSGTSSGTNTGDQTISLTSDVTGSGTGSFATTIAAGAVTSGKLASGAAASNLGSAGGDLTGTFPSPTIAASAVTIAKLASAVTLDAIATAHATAANVAMNSHILTGLAAGTAAGHSIRFEQIQPISATMYQAVGDGTIGANTGTDNTTPIANAITAAGTGSVFFSDGLYRTTAAVATFSGPFAGPGRLITTESGPAYNARGKFFNQVTTQPSLALSTGNGYPTSIDTGFNGDLTHVPVVIEHRVSGANTIASAAQAASGYFEPPEVGPFYGRMSSSSGRSGAGSSGRTGIWFLNLALRQESTAGGDMAGLQVSGRVAGVSTTLNTTATGVQTINTTPSDFTVGSTAGAPASGVFYLVHSGTVYTVTYVSISSGTVFHNCTVASGSVTTTNGDTVSGRWDQNASIGVLAGGIQPEASGTYLDADELQISGTYNSTDYDVTAVGIVRNFTRNNNTGVLGTFWNGLRFNSAGSKPVDVGMMLLGAGGYDIGIDLSNTTITSAAMALAQEQAIYFNVAAGTDSGGFGFYRKPTSLGTDYIRGHFAGGVNRIDTVVGGGNVLQCSATQVTVGVNFQIADGSAFIAGSSSGTKIGSATSQKIALWNATPIVQPSATTELFTTLNAFGLIPSGATPITTTGVITASGGVAGLPAATAAGQAVRYEQLVGAPSGAMGELLFPGVVDVQIFGPTASATWAKPSGATHLIVLAIGPGGGGGGGVGGAASLFGGSGGGSGDAYVAYLPITGSMSNSVTVQVGAGGAGGAGSATSTGTAGSAGSRSTIFDTSNSTVIAPAGGGGGGGGVGAGTAGAAGAAGTITTYSGLTIASVESAAGAGAQSNITTNAATGGQGSGAAGSGITSGGAVAGSGGANVATGLTLAAATAASVAGAAGAVLGNFPYGAFGTNFRFGGGGGAAITGASTAGAGGAGYTGGGGGGGGSSRSGTGGAGGKGGDGRLICISLA